MTTRRRLNALVARSFAGGAGIDLELELDVSRPGITVLFGPSGAGKTTLLRCLAGLDPIDEGRVVFDDVVWEDSAAGVRLRPQKRQLTYLHQDYALFPHLSVADNVGFGLRRGKAAERAARVERLLARLEIGGLRDRLPGELSGGQQQRVALARALAPQPRLLLLDEPFSALDRPTRKRLLSFVRGVLGAEATTTILVTHDWEEALTLGDELVVLHEGTVLQQGPPADVFARPASLEVAAALGVETVATGRIVRRVNHLLEIDVNGTPLWAVGGRDWEGRCYCCIRASDVVLEVGEAERSSARNHLPGRVRSVEPQGELFHVTVDVGFPIVALVTGASRLELGLEPGRRVRAVVKASTIHLIEAH